MGLGGWAEQEDDQNLRARRPERLSRFCAAAKVAAKVITMYNFAHLRLFYFLSTSFLLWPSGATIITGAICSLPAFCRGLIKLNYFLMVTAKQAQMKTTPTSLAVNDDKICHFFSRT